MIFVTIGSMLPFDRLIKTVDEWANENAVNEIYYQIGNGQYVPQTGSWERSLNPAEFNRRMLECRFVIGHLGMGTVISGMTYGKRLVLMPRQKALGEHTTDHQVHAVPWISHKPGITIHIHDEDLKQGATAAMKAEAGVSASGLRAFASDELIGNIQKFIKQPMNHHDRRN